MKYIMVAVDTRGEHIFVGPRGGKYIIRNDHKVYIPDDIQMAVTKFNTLSEAERNKSISVVQSKGVGAAVVSGINKMSAAVRKKFFNHAYKESQKLPDSITDGGNPKLNNVPKEEKAKLLNSVKKFWKQIRPMDGEPTDKELAEQEAEKREISGKRAFIKFSLYLLGAASFVFGGSEFILDKAGEYSWHKNKDPKEIDDDGDKSKGIVYDGTPDDYERNNDEEV